MDNRRITKRQTIAALALAAALLLTACGGESTIDGVDDAGVAANDAVEESTETQDSAAEVETVSIEEREAEVVPAAEGMFAFIAANPDVCTAEFDSFNVAYPEDRDSPEVAELDAGIEDRGIALQTCLDDAGEIELSEDVSLLTQWGRHLADQEG